MENFLGRTEYAHVLTFLCIMLLTLLILLLFRKKHWRQSIRSNYISQLVCIVSLLQA